MQQKLLLHPEITRQHLLVISEIAPGDWLCESEMGQALLKSGGLVGSANHIWRLVIANPFQDTIVDPWPIEDACTEVRLHFHASQNEEHVQLKIHIGQTIIDLQERTHHYVLLLLARQYTQDTEAQRIETERGWIDKEQLCRQMGVDLNHLNILIFRFRKQLMNALPPHVQPPSIVQTRVGQVRIQCAEISITGGLPTHTQHQSS